MAVGHQWQEVDPGKKLDWPCKFTLPFRTLGHCIIRKLSGYSYIECTLSCFYPPFCECAMLKVNVWKIALQYSKVLGN